MTEGPGHRLLHVVGAVLLFGALAHASACGAKSGLIVVGVCEPGASESCVGVDGCFGTRTCIPDGSRFSECDCDGLCLYRSFSPSNAAISAHFIVDKSGSMEASWPQATLALRSFFGSPASAGLDVALDFFPSGDSCSVSRYTNPDVAFGTLERGGPPADQHEVALLHRLGEVVPGGNTPLFAALGGGLIVARARADVAADGESVVVVMVTDGAPTTCSDVQNEAIPQLAATESAKEPPVRTFAIGLEGADQELVREIAERGDGQAFTIGTSDITGQLLASFESIRELLACEYELGNAHELDLETLEVTLERSFAPPQTLIRVPTDASCHAGGWVLDESVGATRVTLCQGACDRAQLDERGTVEIRAECAGG